MTRLTGLALLALAFGATALVAKKPDVDQSWTSLAVWPIASEVRVTLTEGRDVRGSLVSAGADSLVVKTKNGERALAQQGIQRVRVKGPRRRLRHTLIGLAVGAGGGGAIAAAAHGSKCTGFCVGPDVGYIVTVASVPVGAVLGSLVGAALPAGGWKEIYLAPRGSSAAH